MQSPLYMNLVVTARTGISARANQRLGVDLHIASLSGGIRGRTSSAAALDIIKQMKKDEEEEEILQSSAFCGSSAIQGNRQKARAGHAFGTKWPQYSL